MDTLCQTIALHPVFRIEGQPPEVNYLPRFENVEPPRMSTMKVKKVRGFQHSQLGVHSTLVVADGWPPYRGTSLIRNSPAPQDSTVSLCLGPYDGPGGGGGFLRARYPCRVAICYGQQLLTVDCPGGFAGRGGGGVLPATTTFDPQGGSLEDY